MLPLDNAASNQSVQPIVKPTLPAPAAGCLSIQTLTVHLSETDRRYTVTVMIAGARADDLTVTIEDNVVYIATDASQHGKQSVKLPQPIDTDTAHAVLDGNILTLHIPKQTADDTPRHIPVAATPPTIEAVYVD